MDEPQERLFGWDPERDDAWDPEEDEVDETAFDP